MNRALMYGFLDELEKHAEGLRSLGFTDPAARKNLAKAVRKLPKGGAEGRHSAIKEMRKGFKHYQGRPGGPAAIAATQRGLAEADID